MRLDLADPLDHHRVVIAMRAAMERQADPQRRRIARRQQHAIAAEIIEARPFPANRFEQAAKTALRQQLPGQQMVALEPRIIAGGIGQVNRAERERGAFAGWRPQPDRVGVARSLRI
jgi:hypothetical protein